MADQTTSVGMERKLAAIFSTDVAGYSRLMGDDEEATIHTLTAYRALISSLIQHHRGRVIDSPGDNLLAEFASVVDAVRCAVEIQHTLKERNADLPEQRQMRFRIGINLGDVIVEGERLYGDGVNIAARMESLAVPGGICISGTVYDQIETKLALTYEDLGEQAVNVQDIGKELGVRYVLEGSVQKAGEQVRIVTQLIDTTTDSHLWAERYDRPLKDIFVLQDEIVQKIVTTLKLQLTLQEQGFLVRKHTNNLEAYDAFLHGQEYFWRFTKETNAQARQMFEKAVALDPQYAEAYAGLGLTYREEWTVRWSTDPQTLERALALAQQALALDDSLPFVHFLLSAIYELKQQYEQAIAEGERAVALDPNNADSYAVLAQALNFAGRHEEALRMMAQAMRLNPRYPFWYLFDLGWAYRSTGRYAEAIATLKEVISRSPIPIFAHLDLAISYLLQWLSQQSPPGQALEPAVVAAQRALALNDSWHFNHVVLGLIYLNQQQYDQALAEMERAVALAPTEAGTYAALAVVLSYMGRTEDALQAAAQALHLKPAVPDEHLANVGIAYAVAGHYEEAVAPLKQYLSRYPNILPAHLTLAAVYSELGQTAEAQKEAAEVLRINPHFSLEVAKQRSSIKDPAALERGIVALRKAGLK